MSFKCRKQIAKFCYNNFVGKSTGNDCNVSLLSCLRWSGCVITAGSSRRSWPSRVIGSLVQLGDQLASVQPSASHPCAKLSVTKSSDLAPKHPLAQPPQSKTPTDQVSLGPYLAQTLGHVVSHHKTRKMNTLYHLESNTQSRLLYSTSWR